MKTLLIIALLFTFSANAQSDTATNLYVQVPQSFITKYNNGKLKVGVNQFNGVQAKDGNWYASANTIKDFETQLLEAGITKANIINHIVRLKRNDFPDNIVSAGTTTKTQ